MTERIEFSDVPRWLWIYRFDDAGIFTGTIHYYVAPHTGLPANCTLQKCSPKAGQAGVWNGRGWEYVADVRGAAYWDREGQAHVQMSLQALPEWAVTQAPPPARPGFVVWYADDGWQQTEDRTGQTYYQADGTAQTVPDARFVLPEDCTFTAPASPWDRWNGKAWVTDSGARQLALTEEAMQMRAQHRREADQQIELLKDAVDTGIAVTGDETRLAEWKKYRVMLSRLDMALAPDIPWPDRPD